MHEHFCEQVLCVGHIPMLLPFRKGRYTLCCCYFVNVLMIISRWVEAITTWSGLFKFRSCFSNFFVQSYVMFDQVFWRAIAGQINRWRRNLLHLGPTSLDKMEPHKIPFLYNFSPHVVPPPLDWPEWIRVTGLFTQSVPN